MVHLADIYIYIKKNHYSIVKTNKYIYALG